MRRIESFRVIDVTNPGPVTMTRGMFLVRVLNSMRLRWHVTLPDCEYRNPQLKDQTERTIVDTSMRR